MSDLKPLVLLTDDLIVLPTLLSIRVEPYRRLFRKFHADPEFCETAFGDHFLPRSWSDEEVTAILQRDIDLRWKLRGMGDFAVGLLSRLQGIELAGIAGTPLQDGAYGLRIVEDPSVIQKISETFDQVNWVGYVCVRDATPGCPDPALGQPPLPPWQDMIEVRYGLDASARGKGVISTAQAAIMQWSIEERGARRFVAECLAGNEGSIKALRRLGFVRSETRYWDDEGLIEWVKPAAG